MKKLSMRLLGLAVSMLLAVVGVVAIESTEQPAVAADASRFDPGLIISDSVFYDFGTMTVADIQRFLESKVPNCIAKPGAPPCLRNYMMNTPAVTGEDGRCDSLPAQTNVTAAQVIYQIAYACKINPKVLLVTLQKEQGLITSPNPTEYKYRAALGMSCPDSNLAQCGQVDAGFFMQLYKGAGQFQWYNDVRGSFTYHKVGRISNIRYDTDASCGTKPVLIKSWATAALYYYTPYTPNAAALANLYSTGDSCSAYGNRNFWRYYTDWFGSTIGGGFLLKGSGSDIYLIVDNNRYRIPDQDMVAALQALGPLGTVSDDYLSTFTLGQDLTRVVKSVEGTFYLYDGSKKFAFTGCDQVTSFGFDCGRAVQLTSSQLSALSDGGPVSNYISTDGTTSYLIESGKRREILDPASLASAGYSLGKPATISAAAFKHLPWGVPIVNNNTVFKNRTTSATMLATDSKIYEVDALTASDIDLAKWMRASVGTLSSAGIAPALATDSLRTIVKGADGTNYLITTFGKRPIVNPAEFYDNATLMPDSFLSAINTITKPITAPSFVKSSVSKSVFLVAGAKSRETVSAAQRAKFSKVMTDSTVHILPASAFKQISAGVPVISPMQTVRVDAAKQLYVVDGFDQLYKVSSAEQAAAMGFSAPTIITAAQLKGYQHSVSLTASKVACGDQILIGANSKYYLVAPEVAAHYPGEIVNFSPLTCATITKSATKLGRFVKGKDASLWLIDLGKRRSISTEAKYVSLRGDSLPAVSIDDYSLNAIPRGKAAGKTMPTNQPSATSAPTASPTPSPSTTPTVSPTPTPSPTATSMAGTLKPATLVTYRENLYLVNGTSKLALFDAAKRAELFGLKNPLAIEPSVFESYDSTTIIDSAKAKCGTQIYLVLLGTYYPISSTDAIHYPGKSLTLANENCAVIKKSTTAAGRFVLSQVDNRYYLIEKFKRRPIADEATYLALKGDAPAALKIGPYLTSTLALGAEMLAPSATPTPSVSPTPSPTPST
jgi:hypothetical protein